MLTADDLVYVRQFVGDTSPTDAELHAVHDRVGDRDQVVREVLSRRLATLLSEPASFSVAGEYGQSTATNIAELRRVLALFGGPTGEGEPGSVRFVKPGHLTVR